MDTKVADAADRPENSSPRTLKIVARVVFCLIGLAVLAFSALYFLNSRDEPLNATARAALEKHYDSIPRRDNLYFAVLAIDSQNDTDINADGQRAYDRYLTARKTHGDLAYSFAKDAPFARQPIATVSDSLCGVDTRPENGCIERARLHKADFLAAVSANQRLIDRYQSLAAYSLYENPVVLSVVSPIPSWQPFLSAKRLWLVELALDVNQGKDQEAIRLLQADATATRQWLRQPDLLLLEKLIFAASYRQTLLFVSDLVRTSKLTAAEYQTLTEIVAPLSADERALGGVFAREFTAVPALFQKEQAPHFLKPNATINLFWERVEANRVASEASCREFPERAAAVPQAHPLAWLSYAYNPVGKTLFNIAAPRADRYIMAMCDLQGMQDIVALQIAIQSEHIPDSDLETYVQHAAQRNPYTGAPFTWDPTKRTLGFEPVTERDLKFIPWSL